MPTNSEHNVWWGNKVVRELKVPQLKQPSEIPLNYHRTFSTMERRYVRNSNYPRWNNNVLLVVLYLTLPPINCHQNSSKESNRKVKSRKQQQRDYDRMKQFNEQKTVCDIFPYS